MHPYWVCPVKDFCPESIGTRWIYNQLSKKWPKSKSDTTLSIEKPFVTPKFFGWNLVGCVILIVWIFVFNGTLFFNIEKKKKKRVQLETKKSYLRNAAKILTTCMFTRGFGIFQRVTISLCGSKGYKVMSCQSWMS